MDQFFMHKIFLLWLTCVFLTCCKPENEGELYQKIWVGTINAPGQSISLNFGFDKSFFGTIECKISIPQQQVFELQASECRIIGDSLYLKFSDKMLANYKAKLVSGHISGKWTQGNYSFPLTLQNSGRTLFQLYTENALNIAKENALNAREVDWITLRKTALAMTEKSTDQLIAALQLILRNLKDKHGFILFNNKSINYETDNFENISPALSQAAHGNDKDIVSVLLSDSIAYLRIPKSPDFQSNTDETYNQQIQKHVCNLITKNASNWIIDLRLNYGGNMFAMLAGLNKLLGDGKVGAFVNEDGKESGTWIMKGGNFYNQQEQKTSSGTRCATRIKPGKIAILTGPITASSGEAVAIALRSLDDSQIFGEPSKGSTTALSGFNIGKDLTFFISTGYYSDGKGHIYKNGVPPDVLIKNGDNFDEIQQDEKVKAAVQWIQN